ncbi:MAG: NYN domain-containing protein [Candidatus Mariimomonas ferrooxydans]
MAFILIDGYNLIGIAHKDLEKARSELIQNLSKYSELRGHHITLVFDGWKSGQGMETNTRVKDVTIIYSRIGEKADTVIKRIISESRRSLIVVSSDREIADFANRKDCVSLASEEFNNKLHACLHATGHEGSEESFIYDDGDAEATPALQKGNPWKPSKKIKKKLRALKKL